jgi:uncharacterized GH25 family protein
MHRSVIRFIIVFSLILTIVPATAFSHNLWLNATDYEPGFRGKTGAHTKVYFGFGHRLPVMDFPKKENVTEFKLVKPGGESKDLELGEGGFLATPIILKKEGGYMVTTATKPGFYTMYEEEGKVHHKLGTMEGLDNIVLSIYYESYAKTLINVGKTEDDAYATPVGHHVEIVPLENPFLKKVGDYLEIQVLINGKPAMYTNVFATWVGFSPKGAYAYTSKTNAKGINQIKLLQSGQWVVKVVVKQPPSKKHQGKVIDDQYTTILTFQVD